MSEHSPIGLKAAVIHGKSGEIEEKLNKWLEENGKQIAEIVNTSMSNSHSSGGFRIANSLGPT